jgi:hypothetical protein
MDASLLRIVTRDSDIRKLLVANRASIDKSRFILEAGLCEARLDLFSGISEILLTANQKMRPNTR